MSIKIEKSVQMTLIIAGTILILGLLFMSLIGRAIPDLQNTISSSGDAEVQVTPDVVSIYLAISELGETTQEAKDSADAIYEDIVTRLVRKGLDKNEITTQNYDINEDYSWINNNQKLNGYRVTHSLKISFPSEDSDLISDVLDIAVDSGASFSYINFELSQELENEYKAQALLLATEDAKGKAEAIAEGLDKDLGKLVSVSTDHFYYEPWKAYDYALGGELVSEAVESRVTEIIPSERTVSARITVVYKIK